MDADEWTTLFDRAAAVEATEADVSRALAEVRATGGGRETDAGGGDDHGTGEGDGVGETDG